MSQLAISLFGPMQVTLDGSPATGFSSVKARALLVYLAVESGRPHSREELMGLLWPDYPETSARTSLRSALANVRRVIGDQTASPPFLLITRETIQFNQDSDHHLDVDLLDALLTADQLDRARLEQLSHAVGQAEGYILAGFSLPDGPEFEAWLLLRREYYGRQLALAFGLLIDHYEADGETERALGYARRRAALNPWQEEAYRQLLRLLASTGQRSQALIDFESWRRELADELDVEPSDETIALVEQIRGGELAGQTGSSPMSSVALRIPTPLVPLIGREVELEKLTTLLDNPNQRLITIVGPGGMGKTHLALALAARQGQNYGDGVALVLLAPIQSIESMVPAIADALHFIFSEDTPPKEQLVDYLSNKELLLVMDNFEHLLDGAGLLLRVLERAPRLKILTTSRSRLSVQGEQLFPLNGLSVSDGDSATAPPDGSNDAVALFIEHAQRLQPDFQRPVDHTAMREIERLCRLMHGMPLGILLAANWIGVLSPREIADEIERDFRFLQLDSHGLPDRHQSLEAVFDHSWTLLSEREKTIFRRFSIFRGGCTREAMQIVTEAALVDIQMLTRKSLLSHVSAGSNSSGSVLAERYQVHELLRQFGARRLGDLSDEEMKVRQRHGLYFSGYLAERIDDLKGARQSGAMAEIETEGENIRIAWRWAADHKLSANLDSAIEALGLYYERRGRFQDGESACRAAADQLETSVLEGSRSSESAPDGVGMVNEQRMLAKILGWQARFNRHLGNFQLARELTQRGLEFLSSPNLADTDVRQEKADILFEMGKQAASTADAGQFFAPALDLYQSLGDRWGSAHALYHLGLEMQDKPGGNKAGEQLAEEAHDLFQELGDRLNAGRVLEEIGFDSMLRGRHAKGEIQLRQSLAMSRETSGLAGIATGMTSLAIGLIFCGKFAEVEALAFEHAQICRILGNRPAIARANRLLALSSRFLGQYTRGYEYATKALREPSGTVTPLEISYALWLGGDILLAQRTYPEALEKLQESITIHRRERLTYRLRDVLTSCGYAAFALGETELLYRCLVEALDVPVDDRPWFTFMRAVSLAALYSVAQGDAERAVELYALAYSAPHFANSPWYEEVVGRHVAAAAANLPDKIVAAAQERGRSLDLWQTAVELLESNKLAG